MTIPILKACPFCKGKALLDREKIYCDCGANIEIKPYVIGNESVAGFPTYERAKREMIEAWNTRIK